MSSIGVSYQVITSSVLFFLMTIILKLSTSVSAPGVSFRSEDQACANAGSEIGKTSFEDIEGQAKKTWLEKRSKIEIDVGYYSA